MRGTEGQAINLALKKPKLKQEKISEGWNGARASVKMSEKVIFLLEGIREEN